MNISKFSIMQGTSPYSDITPAPLPPRDAVTTKVSSIPLSVCQAGWGTGWVRRGP